MPAPTPFASPHSQMYPALYLYPLNDSFVPKHISLVGGQRVKIGRQTNAKTVPGERNGYFDSKVLSRQHAEIWEEGGKIYIKDVKSSNGTFINGERLSPEGMESDPWDLKSDDIVEFGIDIVGDDNKILHYKVAARVFCIFNEQDLQIALRSEQHQQQQHHQQSLQQHGGAPSSLQAGPSSGVMNSSSFNFGANPANGPPRRTSSGMQPGIAGMGGMGGGMRAPGKSGLTFEHILNRLQGELQKSRETGSELTSLNGTMGEVQDTLGGSLPPNLPPYPHTLPPARPPQPAEVPEPEPPVPAQPPISSTALSELQDQLRDTQASLAAHVDKIRELEDLLKEQEVIKREVHELRDIMLVNRRPAPHGDSDETSGMDDDDAHSVLTAVPHELEPVAEEDEEQEVEREREEVLVQSREEKVRDVEEEAERDREDEERRRRNAELGRPRTPEPASMGMFMDEKPAPQPNQSTELLDALNTRLTSLSSQFESFLTLTTSLQAQHDVAQSTISNLQAKVNELESMVKATQDSQQNVLSASLSAATAAVTSALAAREAEVPSTVRDDTEVEKEKESLTQMLSEWKRTVEGQWSSVKEEWVEERSRLSKVREEWEAKVKQVDTGIATLTALHIKADSSSSSSDGTQVNGDVHHGLVTPPSPRSLSADSRRSSRGSRRKRSGSSRGRAGDRSRSQSPGTSASSYEDGMTDSTSITSVSQNGVGDDDLLLRATSPFGSTDGKARSSKASVEERDFANESEGETLGSLLKPGSFPSVHLLTEGSLCSDSSTATDGSRLTVTANLRNDGANLDSPHVVGDFATTELERKRGASLQYFRSHPIPTTAFSVLVIGVAAAVLWKVKE